MLKKLLRLLRLLIIGSVWTYLWLVAANFLFYYVWSFNFFNPRSWETIWAFWNAGGIIKTRADYLFLCALAAVPLLWLWGWRLLSRLCYLDFLLAPLNLYNRWIFRKYGADSSRLILKNLHSGHEQLDAVKQKLESIKPEKPKEVNSIREQVQQKLSSAQNQPKE